MNRPITAVPVPAITTTSTPYSSGDVVGGLIKFLPGQAFGTAEVRSILITDNLAQNAALTIYLFTSLPAGAYTDNGAFTWGTGDLLALMSGAFGILTTDYTTVNGKSFAYVPCQGVIRWEVKPDDATQIIYGVVVTTSTPTYGANATTLGVTLGLGYSQN